MTDSAGARRFALLEMLAEEQQGMTLAEAAERLGVDERTIRRDVEAIQSVLQQVGNVHLVRGRLEPFVTDPTVLGSGSHRRAEFAAKTAMARAAVRRIPDGSAVVLTAGTSTLAVAVELKRAQIQHTHPTDLIVFSNSLPALLELVAGGVSTGVLGEVYNPRDCAFHSHELRTRFHASMAIVGASGVILEPAAGSLSLCSDRIEEAAFMRQLLGPVPEILLVAEAGKIGRHHPWSFTSDGLLVGKRLHIVTTPLERWQSDGLAAVADSARRSGITLSFEEVAVCVE